MFWPTVMFIHFFPQIMTVVCLASTLYLFKQFARWYWDRQAAKDEAKAARRWAEECLRTDADYQNAAYVAGDPYGTYGDYHPTTMPDFYAPEPWHERARGTDWYDYPNWSTE